MINSIQGKDVVLSFLKDEYIPYMCASDFSVEIDTQNIDVRTTGDGRWSKKTYQSASYTITLSGVVVVDLANFTSWDIFGNQLQMLEIPFRASFIHLDGTIKSIQGSLLINKSTFSFTVGDIVKGSHTFDGNGELQTFDGLIPCDTVITTIAVAGQVAPDGTITITYSYTGPVYQVKYQIDGQGDYAFALVGVAIVVPGLAIGDHFVNIIPICTNNFEGTGETQDFQVTQALTCGSVITNITINTSPSLNATNTVTGVATQMKYRIDGGMWITAAIGTPVSLAGLSVGAHAIEEVPVCSNGISGTGFVKNFTVSSSPSQSMFTYDFENSASTSDCEFRIFVNGVLTIAEFGTASGSFVVPIGQTVIAEFTASSADPSTPITGLLKITDTTTSGIVTNQTHTARTVGFSFSFVPSGDNFLIQEIVTP